MNIIIMFVCYVMTMKRWPILYSYAFGGDVNSSFFCDADHSGDMMFYVLFFSL